MEVREEEAAGRMQSLSLWVVGSIPAVAISFLINFFFSSLSSYFLQPPL